MRHSETGRPAWRASFAPAEGPAILTEPTDESLSDEGLACRMAAGPDEDEAPTAARHLARRPWSVRGHRPRKK